MIFRQLFQERFTVGVVDTDSADRQWIVDRLHLDNVDIVELSSVNALMAYPARTDLDVVLLGIACTPDEPVEVFRSVRRELPRTALILLDDFDDGRLSQLARQIQCQDVLLKPELTSSSLTRSVLFSIQRFRIQLESERLRVEAEELAKAKVDFASMVSHEILNPMTGILGYLDILKRTDLTKEQSSYVSTIRSSCWSLSSLVKDLLAFTNLDQGGVQLKNESFSPYELFFELERQLRGQNECPQVRVIVHCDPDLPTLLRGDPLKLRQVAFNLAQNALKFTRQGHVAVLLRKIGESDGTVKLRLAIEDSGIGIPESKIDTILQPFTQARAEDRHRGHGLGLAIVVKLLDRLGSELKLKSVVGRGTVFWCDIEVEKDEAAGEFRTPLQGRRIVLLDSNPLAWELVKETLERLGGQMASIPSTEWPEGEIDWVFAEAGYPDCRAILDKVGNHVNRVVYGCAYEQNSQDGVGRFEGTCPPHRLVELLKTPVKDRLPHTPSLPTQCCGSALVVDDDPICRDYLVSEFRRFGLATDSAESGAQALELARRKRYNVVSLDGHLGEMTGSAVYRCLRKENLIDDGTLVLIVTGDPDSWQRDLRDSDQSLHVVGKPVGRAELATIFQTEFGHEVFDPVRLNKLKALGRETMRKLFGSFQENLPGMLTLIENAVTKQNPEDVYQAAHRLKGSAATLGLSNIAKCAAGLEAATRAPQTWRSWCKRLEQAVDNLDIETLLSEGDDDVTRSNQVAISS